MALNSSPEFCLKLTYRYLLKAGAFPGDTWGRVTFAPGANSKGHNFNKLGRGPLGDITD